MERSAARHAAHREDLQLYSLAGQVCPRFIPINLSFRTPVVALRYTGFACRQPEFLLALLYVLAHAALAHIEAGNLGAQSLPNPMGRVPLFPRRPAILV